MNTAVLLAIIGGAFGLGGAVATVAVKRLNRDVDQATATATRSTANKNDLDVLRGVIAELRDDKAEASQRIEALEQRMALIEERERHALTRAAVHEAWDQLAFATLTAQNPAHPPPPPLTLAKRERDERNAREDRTARNSREERDARNLREDRRERNQREDDDDDA